MVNAEGQVGKSQDSGSLIPTFLSQGSYLGTLSHHPNMC